MTRPEWEPLTTAEAIVEALEAGRKVQWTFLSKWNDEDYVESVARYRRDIELCISYRARIEGGGP